MLIFLYIGLYAICSFLGAGHGLTSILLILLSFPDCYINNPEIETNLKDATNFVLNCEDSVGNYPPMPGEVRDDWNELVHWCHGAPGVVYLLTKAYLIWKEEKYLQAAVRCGEVVWKKGLLRKGPGICHGIAG